MANYPIGSFGSQPPGPTGGGGGNGNWVWDGVKGTFKWIAGNAGDILQTGAGVLDGIMSSQDRKAQLEELRRQYDESLKQRQAEQGTSREQFGQTLAETQAAREQSGGQFERTTGDAEAQAAVRAQTQLNAAPMADKAQALLLSRMGVSPGQFQGRDYTKGTSDLTRTATAPGASVTSAMQSAASGYKPGDGGVDTSTMRMLLNKMKASGFRTPTAPVPRPPTPPGPPGPPGPAVPPVFPPTMPRPRIGPPGSGGYPPPDRPRPTLPTSTTPPPPPPTTPTPPAPRPTLPIPGARPVAGGTSPGDILKRRMGLMV